MIAVIAFALGAVLSGSGAMYSLTRPQCAPLRMSLERYHAALRTAGAGSIEEVAIEGDGAHLVGTLARPGTNDRHEAVLVAHGLGDDRTGLAEVAALLVHAGYTVLSIDERGHGLSSAAVVTFGIREHLDLERWIDWLRAREHPRCVHGYGLSMGASSLLLAAAHGAPLCSVWADSAYASFEQITSDQSGAVLGFGSWFGRTLGRPATTCGFVAARLVRGIDLAEAAPLRTIAKIAVPLMLVQGDADRLVLPINFEHLSAAKPDAQHWLVAGAGHVRSREVAGRAYDERLLAWLAAAQAR